jgi:adenosyl cobinamide kinase/adenosyl cobinamide phosphate guanylyltransferase
MRLITGGAYQGKTEYAMNIAGISKDKLIDGADCNWMDWNNVNAINHFHLLIKRLLLEHQNVLQIVKEMIKVNPEIVIITNELGCGVVPVDAFDRNYREVTGRICCFLAKEASQVHRVICGIGQVIKHD